MTLSNSPYFTFYNLFFPSTLDFSFTFDIFFPVSILEFCNLLDTVVCKYSFHVPCSSFHDQLHSRALVLTLKKIMKGMLSKCGWIFLVVCGLAELTLMCSWNLSNLVSLNRSNKNKQTQTQVFLSLFRCFCCY